WKPLVAWPRQKRKAPRYAGQSGRSPRHRALLVARLGGLVMAGCARARFPVAVGATIPGLGAPPALAVLFSRAAKNAVGRCRTNDKSCDGEADCCNCDTHVVLREVAANRLKQGYGVAQTDRPFAIRSLQIRCVYECAAFLAF